MAKEWQDIYYSFREIDGYNKAFNFVMSARELGKTTTMWLQKIYNKWKKTKRPWYYVVRNTVEITEALIDSIADTIINKFTDDDVKLEYKTGDFKGGIVDVRIKGECFFRIVSLSCKLRKIKLAILENSEGAFMDEYIIDPQTKERYLSGEAFKLKEAYNTWRRGYGGDGVFKMYFNANPYTLHNPLFIEWKVETNKLKRGSFYVGETFVIQWALLSETLKEKLLRENPLYKFDDDYSKYALYGVAIQDTNIKIAPFPSNYRLQFIFKYDKILVGIFQNWEYEGDEDRFYCKQLQSTGRRDIICFDFNEMIEGTILLGSAERLKLKFFKECMRQRLISFENINLYYIIKEIYAQL